MREKQKYLEKINSLVKLADEIINILDGDQNYITKDSTDRRQFLSECEQFITNLYGIDSTYHKNYLSSFKHNTIQDSRRYAESKGVLLSIKNDIEQGWLDSTRNELSAEIFGEYLEMATYLNDQGFYIAAAVIAGSTLEERLKQLCIKNGLPVEKADANGVMKPIKAENLNTSLVPYYSDGKGDFKLVTANYGLRNSAAHAEWNIDPPEKKNIRIDQVKLMISQIGHFIKTNSL